MIKNIINASIDNRFIILLLTVSIRADGTVERVTHKTTGAHTCAYDITIQH